MVSEAARRPWAGKLFNVGPLTAGTRQNPKNHFFLHPQGDGSSMDVLIKGCSDRLFRSIHRQWHFATFYWPVLEPAVEGTAWDLRPYGPSLGRSSGPTVTPWPDFSGSDFAPWYKKNFGKEKELMGGR